MHLLHIFILCTVKHNKPKNYWFAKGKCNWSIKSSMRSFKVSKISGAINKWESSKSCITNFCPRAPVSSRCSKNCFMTGSLQNTTLRTNSMLKELLIFFSLVKPVQEHFVQYTMNYRYIAKFVKNLQCISKNK